MIDISMEKDARLTSNLRVLNEFAKKAPPRALLDIGNELLRLSQKEVPHDEGTLQNSGTVEEDGDDVLVGYHTPYAHRLHEHPEYKFQKGRKGKYLTDPLERNRLVFTKQLANKLDTDLDRAIK